MPVGEIRFFFIKVFLLSVKMPCKLLEFFASFWDQCAQNMGNGASLTLSSEKCCCLCGLYSQVSVFFVWGPENWNRYLWAGTVVVGEGDGERWSVTVPLSRGCSSLQGTVTGPSLIIVTVLLKNRKFQARLYSLYSRLTPLWEEPCLFIHCKVDLGQ